MKKLFRKAVTVLGSAAMIGSTVALAAAAAYPEPFTSNTAIVVGANAAPSDNIAAASIASNLDANAVSTGTVTVAGGESYMFEKSSTKFNIGDSLKDVVGTSIDDDDLPELLAEGTFIDDDNDEFDYTQKIDVANITLALFEDNDYKSDVPTVGFKISSGENVLNYTLDFTDNPLWTDLETATMTLMGKEYYVLDANAPATNTSITLLDSASDALLTEGETATLNVDGKTYTVTIDFVSSTEAKLSVNGETTNSIAEGQTYKLSDGAYLGLKDILYSAKDTGVSKVEFSIGNGKLVLTNGADVELNEDSIDDLSVSLGGQGTNYLTSVTLQWDADDELFITEDSAITMPGFEAVTMSYTGAEYPSEEEIAIENSGDTNIVLSNFPLKDTTEDIYVLEWDTVNDWFDLVGKDSDEVLLSTNATNVTFDGDINEWAVVSWSDGDDAESYLIRATSFKTENSVNKTTFQYRKDGTWVDAKKDAQHGDDFTIGNVEITIGAINKDDKTVNYWRGNTNMVFDTLYSEDGMKVSLPWTNQDAVSILNNTEYASDAVACAALGATGNRNIMSAITYNKTSTGSTTGTCAETTVDIVFAEEDKDDNIASGESVTVTLGVSGTADTVDVSSYALSRGYNTGGNGIEIDDSDVYRNFVYSDLATEALFDKSGDQETLKLIYHGAEVAVGVYLTSPDATMTSGDAGVMTVNDDAVSTVSGKNLVVVGGSAINSVAAELLGGAYSEMAFTDATGVAAGEFLIESFSRSGKTALLVAGYNAADTEKAVTYLLNNDVDTTVGMKYKGTSATEASLVVA